MSGARTCMNCSEVIFSISIQFPLPFSHSLHDPFPSPLLWWRQEFGGRVGVIWGQGSQEIPAAQQEHLNLLPEVCKTCKVCPQDGSLPLRVFHDSVNSLYLFSVIALKMKCGLECAPAVLWQQSAVRLFPSQGIGRPGWAPTAPCSPPLPTEMGTRHIFILTL